MVRPYLLRERDTALQVKSRFIETETTHRRYADEICINEVRLYF